MDCTSRTLAEAREHLHFMAMSESRLSHWANAVTLVGGAGSLIALLLVAAVLFASGTASAQDGKECFSKLTKYNVCEKARDIQRDAAATLPMKMSATTTMSVVSAAGPRIIMVAIWHTKRSDIDALLRANGMALADLDAKMSQSTRNAVCSQAVMAAFVRLGGQVQYVYKTDDAFVVASPLVTTC